MNTMPIRLSAVILKYNRRYYQMTIHFLTTEISVNAIGFDLLAISSEKSNFNRALLGIWKDKFDGEIIIEFLFIRIIK